MESESLKIHQFEADLESEERVCIHCRRESFGWWHIHIFLRDQDHEPAGSNTLCLCGEKFKHKSHKI